MGMYASQLRGLAALLDHLDAIDQDEAVSGVMLHHKLPVVDDEGSTQIGWVEAVDGLWSFTPVEEGTPCPT